MRYRFYIVLGALGCVLSATTSHAQQTQTFFYDPHGRLVGVDGTIGSETQTTTYGLDNADNRISKVVSSSGSGAMAAASSAKPVRIAALKITQRAPNKLSR